MIAFLCDGCGAETRRVHNSTALVVLGGEKDEFFCCVDCMQKRHTLDNWCMLKKMQMNEQFEAELLAKRKEIFGERGVNEQVQDSEQV